MLNARQRYISIAKRVMELERLLYKESKYCSQEDQKIVVDLTLKANGIYCEVKKLLGPKIAEELKIKIGIKW